MSINLEQFQGRTVVVQLRPGFVWAAVYDQGDVPKPVPVDGGGIAGMPYIEGDVVLSHGVSVIRVTYPKSKRYVEISLHPDAIFAISALGEPVVHKPTASGLLV